MMKTIITAGIFLTMLFSLTVFGSAMDKKRIVELPVPKDVTISFRIMFNAGSQYDPENKKGLAYLTAKMIGEGATDFNSYDAVLSKLFPFAAGINAEAGKEIAMFTGRIHKDNLLPYYKLFTEQILHPAFKEDDLNRVKQDVLNYLSNDLKYSSDEELGKAMLYTDLYSKTPYGHLDMGTISSVSAITVEDIRNFYQTHYNRNNFTLGIGGGYDGKLLQQLWDDLQKLPEGGAVTPQVFEPAMPEGFRATILDKKVAATAISIGYPISITRGTREWYALAIANSWLGEHRNSSSHLYQVIREARGLNYGDYSYIEHYPNGGRISLPPVNVPRRTHLFEIWIRPVPNEAGHFALRAAIREFQKLTDNGMSREQFDLTRKFLKNYVLHYAPTTNKRLAYALDDKFYGINGSHLEIFRKMMDEITLEEVNSAIKKHFQYTNMQISVITEDGEKFKEKLVKNTESPITYTSNKPDSLLKEDLEIMAYPLPFTEDKVRVIRVDELFQN